MEPIEGSETSAFKPQAPGIGVPRKMEPIEGSETSVFKPQKPGKYPKENILHFIILIVSTYYIEHF